MGREWHEIKGLVLIWESFRTERVSSGTGGRAVMLVGREEGVNSSLFRTLETVAEDSKGKAISRASWWNDRLSGSSILLRKMKMGLSLGSLPFLGIHTLLTDDWLTRVNWTAELLWSLQLTSCTWEAVQRFKCMENHERMMFPCFRACPNSFLSVLHFLPL